MIIQRRPRNGTETTNALTNNLALDRNINSDNQKNMKHPKTKFNRNSILSLGFLATRVQPMVCIWPQKESTTHCYSVFYLRLYKLLRLDEQKTKLILTTTIYNVQVLVSLGAWIPKICAICSDCTLASVRAPLNHFIPRIWRLAVQITNVFMWTDGVSSLQASEFCRVYSNRQGILAFQSQLFILTCVF